MNDKIVHKQRLRLYKSFYKVKGCTNVLYVHVRIYSHILGGRLAYTNYKYFTFALRLRGQTNKSPRVFLSFNLKIETDRMQPPNVYISPMVRFSSR